MNIREIPKSNIQLIKPLWEKLNTMHFNDSVYFKDHFEQFTFEKRCESFIDIPDDDLRIFGSFEGDFLIGYCISKIENEAGEIESILIEKEYKGKGIGRELVARSKEWFKERKCKRVVLSVSYGHEEVLGFYEKQGFYPKMIYLQLKE
jgi:ribosomal protein S18 acetylase RimI-like enzyme